MTTNGDMTHTLFSFTLHCLQLCLVSHYEILPLGPQRSIIIHSLFKTSLRAELRINTRTTNERLVGGNFQDLCGYESLRGLVIGDL